MTADQPVNTIKLKGRARKGPLTRLRRPRNTSNPSVQGAMSIWNKVLIGLIIVASLAFVVMVLLALQTRKHWGESHQQHEKAIKEIKEQNRRLKEGWGEGENYQPGIERLQLELQKKLAGRGRVWRQCKPIAGQQTGQTGQVAVTTDVHGIDQKILLHLFVEADAQQPGTYLGEFKVVGIDQAKNVATLLPSMTMTKEELDRLARSAAGNRNWTMYEIMPADSHEAFAHLTEQELKNLFPAGTVEEYLKDGELLTTDEVEKLGPQGNVVAVDQNGRVKYVDQDGKTLYASEVDKQDEKNPKLVYIDEKREFVYAAAVKKEVDADGKIVYDVEYFDENGQVLPAVSVIEQEVEGGKEGKYLRWLRDYEVLLRSHHLQRSILILQIEAANADRDSVKLALAKAEEQRKSCEREQALLTTEKEKCEYARDAVDELLQKLRQEVKAYKAVVDRLIAENMRMAAEIDQKQQEAKQRIDARTGRVAQSGVGETE